MKHSLLDRLKGKSKLWIVCLFTVIILLVLGTFVVKGRWSNLLLSTGGSIMGALLIDLFRQKELKDTLLDMGEVLKTSEEWGLMRLVPSRWGRFYDEIKKSKEIKYLAFHPVSIFHRDSSKRSYIVEFLIRGGKLDLVFLGHGCPAFEVRESDLGGSKIFREEAEALVDGILKALTKLRDSKPHREFRIRIRSTEEFIYGNLIVFDNRLYHYSLNSSAWGLDSGVTIHARPDSKLAELFDELFNKVFNGGKPDYFGRKDKMGIKEFDINYENLDKYIAFFSQGKAEKS